MRLKPIKKQVGIDLGITSLVTTSNGEKVANPKNLQKLHKKLRLAQKSLNRKPDKKSNNYQKARLKVAKIHAKIKDSRLDYTHKLTYVANPTAPLQMIRENPRDSNWGFSSKQHGQKAVRPRDDDSRKGTRTKRPQSTLELSVMPTGEN